MTSFYLLDHKQPVTQQWGYPRRGSKLSGTCILHTAECALDLEGVDTSAEGTANFINNRSDHGSYHVLVDSDSIIWMAPWEYETWQDSQTNPWAVGISAAVQAANWHLIPAVRKDRIYRNMAVAAADFVKYMKDAYGITVPLKRITGDQARAGVPGFCAHGDSGIDRYDPGASFDWALFFKYTAQAIGGAIAPAGNTQEDKLSAAEVAAINKHATAQADRVIAYVGQLTVSGYKVGDQQFPGTSKVDIVNQQLLKTIIGLLEKPDLTAGQITDAVKAGLAEGLVLEVKGKEAL